MTICAKGCSKRGEVDLGVGRARGVRAQGGIWGKVLGLKVLIAIKTASDTFYGVLN